MQIDGAWELGFASAWSIVLSGSKVAQKCKQAGNSSASPFQVWVWKHSLVCCIMVSSFLILLSHCIYSCIFFLFSLQLKPKRLLFAVQEIWNVLHCSFPVVAVLYPGYSKTEQECCQCFDLQKVLHLLWWDMLNMKYEIHTYTFSPFKVLRVALFLSKAILVCQWPESKLALFGVS